MPSISSKNVVFQGAKSPFKTRVMSQKRADWWISSNLTPDFNLLPLDKDTFSNEQKYVVFFL